MKPTPRVTLGIAAVAAFGASLATWWDLAWSDALGGSSAPVAGAAGTGGLAQVLPVAALGGLLLTLTLGPLGRRIVGVCAALIFAGMVAVGVGALAPAVEPLIAATPLAALAQGATAQPTGWVWAYLAASAVGALASCWLVAVPGARRRPDAGASSPAITDTLSSWKAMDDGLDPTDDHQDKEQS